jgi:hypothetical protein
VVGRDDDAIRRGIRHIMFDNSGHAVFFHRLQLPELGIPTAMLLLRMCMVPSMNYLLRCTAPVCIEDEAVPLSPCSRLPSPSSSTKSQIPQPAPQPNRIRRRRPPSLTTDRSGRLQLPPR